MSAHADPTGDGAAAAAPAPVKFKKAKRRSQNTRKRPRERHSDDEEDTTLLAEVTAERKRANKGAAQSKESSSLMKELTVESSRTAAPAPVAGGATATLETETEHDRDATAIRLRALEAAAESEDGAGDKMYKGMASYRSFTRQDKEQMVSRNKVTGLHGPVRAPQHIRSSSRFDYQPDICKDYKETGFCSFGDTCIYIHDRSDYKSGWQLEKEWEEKQKRREARIQQGLPPESDDEEGGEKKEELPFACLICRQRFKQPVQTKCGHYFCQQCALKHYQKSSLCFACKKPTEGVFNRSAKLEARMKELAEREAATAAAETAAAAAAAADGEDTSPETRAAGGGKEGAGGGMWSVVE